MDDKALIAAWQAGDERAATALVARHTDYLTRVAKAYHVQDDVEELVQDVFVRAFKAIDAFSADKSSFRTWLTSVMRYQILDRHRRGRRARLSAPIEAASYVPMREHGALADLIANETEVRLVTALRSKDRKRLLRMRLAGYRWPEIAALFGKDEMVMRARWFLIRHFLEEIVT